MTQSAHDLDIFYLAPASGGYWTHENLAVSAHGQTVYYWVLVIYNGGGYTLTNQAWTEAPVGEVASIRLESGGAFY